MPLLNALFSRDKRGNRKRRLEIQSGNVRFSKDGNASVHKLDEHVNLVIGADGPRLECNEGNLRMTWGVPGEGQVAYQSHEQPAKSCETQRPRVQTAWKIPRPARERSPKGCDHGTAAERNP